MAEGKRQLKVFLCHASADKLAVRDLYKRLIADGVDAWFDAESLIPGQNWQVEIPKAIRESEVVIVCLSEKSVNKEGYVQKEIKFALDIADEKPEGTIFMVPTRLEECKVPIRLSMYHWVDLFEDDGYERLMRALRVRSEKAGIAIQVQPIIDNSLLKIMVTGGRVTSKVVEELAPLIGYQVVMRGHILMNNGTRGVDQKSAEGALRACKERSLSHDKFIQVFRPKKGSIPDFDIVKPTVVGKNHGERTDYVIANSDVVILLGGGDGTREAAFKAQNKEKPIIPIGVGDSTEVAVDLWQKMFNGSYLENSPIGRNDLKRLNLPHSIEKIAVNAIILAENIIHK